MCGPLTFLFPGDKRSLTAYHLARGFAYVFFGVMAGLLGETFLATSLFHSLPWLGVGLFAVYFLWLVRQIWTGRTPRMPIPKSWSQFFLQQSKRFGEGSGRAMMIGLASVFLPCGWLYSFILAALGTRSPMLGATTMFAFWLGTLPALSIAPHMLRELLGGKRLTPRWNATLFLVLGLSAVSLKILPWLASPGKKDLLTVICNPILH